jgi:hypothetical protein
METIYKNLKNKFQKLKMDYLPRSDIPRIRILFKDSNNILSIKNNKDYILKEIFNQSTLYLLIMVWSGNSKKIRKKDIKDLETLNISNYLNKSIEKYVEKLEPNLF